MNETHKSKTMLTRIKSNQKSPVIGIISSILLGLTSLGSIFGGIYWAANQGGKMPFGPVGSVLAAIFVAVISGLLAFGMWKHKDWARTGLIALIGFGLIYLLVSQLFETSSQIFAGEHVVSGGEIATILMKGLLRLIQFGGIPVIFIYALVKAGPAFDVNPEQRNMVDRSVRIILLVTALSSILIVFLIIFFTMEEAWLSIEEIGLDAMLLGTIWRPGSIIGVEGAQYGLIPMIVGSFISTFGAAVLGVPLSIGTAVLLAEVAPGKVREFLRPAIELLAGIPSVVYGLFGMVVLAPLIREIPVPHNTGFGILNASIVLAIMIIPTVTNIAEDAIRAVPKEFKEGSLALGATHWQTIVNVIIPAARSGLIAAVILGIGRALGETMAVIMVIGNSIAIPKPLTDNLLTLILNTARTLTGNIAVEINYAAGAHRSALFFTGIILFIMIFAVNSVARYLMRARS